MKAVQFSDPSIYAAGGYGLESDFHNNFRPEPQFENGKESLWAMQYSINDGTKNGNLNWSYGLIVPNIPGVTDGGCDFYKPSKTLLMFIVQMLMDIHISVHLTIKTIIKQQIMQTHVYSLPLVFLVCLMNLTLSS